ncbi:MAG: hypothetical protein RRY19_06015 [Clostridium sp.]
MKRVLFILCIIFTFSFVSCNDANKTISSSDDDCLVTTNDSISFEKLNSLISKYLETSIGLSLTSNSKVFESHNLIGTELKHNTIYAYIQSFVQEYKVDNNKAYSSSGGDFTGIVYLNKDSGEYKVVSHDFPTESSDSKNLFPKELLKKFSTSSYENIKSKTDWKAKYYFEQNNIEIVENR